MKITRTTDGTIARIKLSGRGLMSADRLIEVDGKTIMTLSNRHPSAEPMPAGIVRRSRDKAATRTKTPDGGQKVLLRNPRHG